MANGDNKIVGIIIKWALGVFTTIAMALAGLAFNSVNDQLAEIKIDAAVQVADRKADKKVTDGKLDDIISALGAMTLTDSLQGRDVSANTKLITDYIERNEP